MDVREPKPGEIIGQNYIIESELGRGGFGVVFKARHVDVERVVAIKVLLATYAAKDPQAVQRFRREATIAASLNYPNTVRVFDYGETDEGVFYLVQEFVSGKTLADTISRYGKLDPASALHILRQILYALTEAHAHGIVHRDIKPENVMIVPLAYDRHVVKVMDFGIAKMTGADESITRAGIALGTPRYMALEQIRGQALSPATDLYAVGLVLFEMLAGRPAIQADTAVDAAVQVLEGAGVTLPDAVDVPDGLRQIVNKACAKHPEDRFQSCRHFLEALERYDGGDVQHLPGLTKSPAAAKADAGKTLALPEVRGADDDPDGVAKTQAIDATGPDAPTGAIDVRRVAETQALPVRQVTGPPATPTATTTTAVPTSDALPRPTTAPSTASSPPSLALILQAATLVAVLIVLIKLFAG